MTRRPDSADGAGHVPVSGKTRRRRAALDAALLGAAWEELQAAGHAGMTMEAVANRAGTSRTVVYRRWPKKADLFIAVLRRHAPTFLREVPDTGSLRGGVLAVLEWQSGHLARMGIVAVILKRAADRGQGGGVSDRVASVPTDLFRHQLFLDRVPPSRDVIVEIVDEVFLPLVRP